MSRFILAALVVGLLVGADKPKKDDKKEATVLEGTWVVVSLTEDGKEYDQSKGEKRVFEGRNYKVKDGRREPKYPFKIDPKRKTIDLTLADLGEGFMGGLVIIKGIYQLKGDELKMCFFLKFEGRPKDFTSEKGSQKWLIVLKRAKAK
jgi:uncharacterized protein (TIGR03067 family)